MLLIEACIINDALAWKVPVKKKQSYSSFLIAMLLIEACIINDALVWNAPIRKE